ncbi:hypothetical protein K9M79_08485 [Candidatus Woesearchaeota archaeon]|nr:hypothetical protein [Candidatus Woesearchaeota archaeon]
MYDNDETFKRFFKLTIGVIVTLILAITMLGLGIAFISGIFDKANENIHNTGNALDAQRQQELTSSCKEEVCLEMPKLELAKGKEYTVFIAFNNKLSSDITYDLSATNDCHELGTSLSDQCGINDKEAVVSMMMEESVDVPKGTTRVLPIKFAAKPSATKSTFIFNIEISQADSSYHSVKTITVDTTI